jgi:hypothetical protein
MQDMSGEARTTSANPRAWRGDLRISPPLRNAEPGKVRVV